LIGFKSYFILFFYCFLAFADVPFYIVLFFLFVAMQRERKGRKERETREQNVKASGLCPEPRFFDLIEANNYHLTKQQQSECV